VIFEAGMAMAKSDRRTVMVSIGPTVELFTDVTGRALLRLVEENQPKFRADLLQQLQNAGCIPRRNSNHASAGDFAGILMKARQGSHPSLSGAVG
jgi:hypothetical protein